MSTPPGCLGNDYTSQFHPPVCVGICVCGGGEERWRRRREGERMKE